MSTLRDVESLTDVLGCREPSRAAITLEPARVATAPDGAAFDDRDRGTGRCESTTIRRRQAGGWAMDPAGAITDVIELAGQD